MIINNLSTIMGSKRISMADLQRRTGLSINTVRRFYYDESKQIDLEVLGKICVALDVQPGDLFKWEEKK